MSQNITFFGSLQIYVQKKIGISLHVHARILKKKKIIWIKTWWTPVQSKFEVTNLLVSQCLTQGLFLFF